MQPTTAQQGNTDSQAAAPAPFTLRFVEWQCGHHGTRPDDIPVHSIEQAQLILQAIGYAISQPGNARVALFNADGGVSLYLTDDHADAVPPVSRWSRRTTIYQATPEQLAELAGLQAAFDYCYGGALPQWDGTVYLNDMEVVTTLGLEAIEAAITPVSWHEQDQRCAVCDVPPVIKPAAELLAELREAAADMAAEAAEAATWGGV